LIKQTQGELQNQQKVLAAFVTKYKIRAVNPGEEDDQGGSSSGSKPQKAKQASGGGSSSKGVLA